MVQCVYYAKSDVIKVPFITAQDKHCMLKFCVTKSDTVFAVFWKNKKIVSRQGLGGLLKKTDGTGSIEQRTRSGEVCDARNDEVWASRWSLLVSACLRAAAGGHYEHCRVYSIL